MPERKEYNGGDWTRSRFQSFIKSILRSGSKKWPCKFDCLNSAAVGKKVNTSTGRLAQHYRCASCGGEYPGKEVQVDHIEPIVPYTGFTTWDEVINRMFCEADNLQTLCLGCHKEKTATERQLAKEYRKSKDE